MHVADTINAAGMDETYGTYVDDECFDIGDTGHDTDDDTDDTNMILMMVGARNCILSRLKDQGARLKAHGSRLKDQRQRIKDQGQGSKLKAQGSRTKVKDQGTCPAVNEHPRRATDVILSQSKAPIEIYKAR